MCGLHAGRTRRWLLDWGQFTLALSCNHRAMSLPDDAPAILAPNSCAASNLKQESIPPTGRSRRAPGL